MDKAVRHLDANQGRGKPRNALEERLLAERMQSDRRKVSVFIVALIVIALLAWLIAS